jgi:hypothetical protein
MYFIDSFDSLPAARTHTQHTLHTGGLDNHNNQSPSMPECWRVCSTCRGSCTHRRPTVIAHEGLPPPPYSCNSSRPPPASLRAQMTCSHVARSQGRLQPTHSRHRTPRAACLQHALLPWCLAACARSWMPIAARLTCFAPTTRSCPPLHHFVLSAMPWSWVRCAPAPEEEYGQVDGGIDAEGEGETEEGGGRGWEGERTGGKGEMGKVSGRKKESHFQEQRKGRRCRGWVSGRTA